MAAAQGILSFGQQFQRGVTASVHGIMDQSVVKR
jgi:hypothetical protein